MNKAQKTELISKIKELDSLSQEDKSALINLLHSKTYGLVWEDKPEDAEEILNESLPVLSEVTDKAIIYNPEKKKSKTLFENSKEEIPNHILIEGDNLHALTTLCFTHENKIDVIYIDPPYNTGNKDFRYYDSRFDEVRDIDKENPFRHSMWLSFMNKRLKLAKLLLKDTGVIFVSIDDNEVAQLKLLCDEIFREENFISNTVRITTKRVKGDSDDINKIHDYILVYSKTAKYFIQHKQKQDYSIYTEKDKYFEDRGCYLIRPLDNGTINYSSKLDYEIIAPDNSIIVAGGNASLREKRLKGNHGKKDWCFRWSKEKLEWGLKNGFIVFKKNKDKYRAYFKIYQFVDNKLNTSVKLDNYLSVLDNLYNNQGTSEVKNILGTGTFTYPKPISLLNEILIMTTTKKSIVLDFFAGSGTTLHATMALNSEDEGNRQCILVTNNENEIAEKVCYKRNKRVIEGYKKPNGEKVDGLAKNNLRYYKTAFVGREKTLKNKRQLTALATDLLCIKENCYTEKKGAKNIRMFQNKKTYLMVIYDDIAIPNAIEIIKKLPDELNCKVYVFSEGQDPYTEDFEEALHKVELCALPDAIYKAYQNILPKAKKKRVIEEILTT